MVPLATRRPLWMMPTRSHNRSATSRMWVEKKTVPPRRVCSRSSSFTTYDERGSSPTNGSSRTSSAGRTMSAPTRASFWRMPWE